MAEKRCFTKKITESDSFLEMPLSAQCLYFHLNMSADDDGFVNAPKRIQRMIGASEDDLKLLIAKSFILVFENGVIVIKHWRMSNTLQNDRYRPTDYQEEFKMLDLKDNKSYTWNSTGNKLDTEWIQIGNKLDPDWKQNGNKLDPQHNITKHNITKHNKKENIKEKKSYGEFQNVELTEEELQKLKDKFQDYEKRIESLSQYIESTGKKYKSHYATILTWSRNERETKTIYHFETKDEKRKREIEELRKEYLGNDNGTNHRSNGFFEGHLF